MFFRCVFDRVNHWYLLRCGLPKLIVWILLVCYSTQNFTIKWCNCISTSFSIDNGVCEGGILSSRLFNVFIDYLSVLINFIAGCHMNDVCYNHLHDISVMISPSPTGLQLLLNICEKFAKKNNMVFYSKKTFSKIVYKIQGFWQT